MKHDLEHVVLLSYYRPEPFALLDADPGVLLTVVTESYFSHHYPEHADVRIVSDIENVTEVRQIIFEIAQKARIDYVVPTFEMALQSSAYARSLFNLGPDGFDLANRLTNKYAMKEAIAAAGLPVTGYAIAHNVSEIADVAEALGWPVVVKPVLGGGCWNVIKIQDPADLHSIMSSPAGENLRTVGMPLLVEKYVPLDFEYHCDGVVVDGKVVFAEVSRYLRPLLVQVGGTLTSSTLSPESPRRPEIMEFHQKAVEALGMTSGVTHMEILESSGRLLFGECAGRPAGAHLARNIELSRGVDLWRCYVDLALGRTPAIAAREPEAVYTVVHFPTARGYIKSISTAEDFKEVPDVVEVNISAKVGQRTPSAFSTANISGSVILRMKDESKIDDRLKRIEEIFTVEVDPV